MLAYLLCLSSLMPQSAGSPPDPEPRAICEHEETLARFVVHSEGDWVTLSGKTRFTRWNAKTGEKLWSVEAKLPEVAYFDISEVQLWYAGANFGHTLGFEFKDGKELKGMGGSAVASAPSALACDPKGRWIWLGFNGGAERLTIDNVQGFSRRAVPNQGITALAMSDDGKLLAVGGQDGSVRFFNATSANLDDKLVLEGHGEPVKFLAFDAKSKLLAAGSSGGKLRIWNMGSRRCTTEIEHTGGDLTALAMTPKGDQVASADARGKVRLWNVKDGTALAGLEHKTLSAARSLVFVDKGATLAASGAKSILLFDLTHLAQR